jgi:hypothetical protein
MFVVAHGITPDLMLSLQTPLYQRSMCHFYFKLLLHLDCKSTNQKIRPSKRRDGFEKSALPP